MAQNALASILENFSPVNEVNPYMSRLSSPTPQVDPSGLGTTISIRPLRASEEA